MCVLFVLLSLLRSASGQGYGPYYYPTGSDTDSTFITFGVFNTTHFYINIFTDEHWFGFAFASGSGCTPSSQTCSMVNADAIVFGQEGATLTAKEFKLGDHNIGLEHASQDLEVSTFYQCDYTQSPAVCEYSANIRRPYNPSLYGDNDSYTITYPLAGNFCWLWAQGPAILFTNGSQHINKGHECIDFGGTTNPPTPSPSYGPTPYPSTYPTRKPSHHPSVNGDTAYPTRSPTKEPSKLPTTTPTNIPTVSPTPSPTVMAGSPTRAPTRKPTPTPTDEPIEQPTMVTLYPSKYPTVLPTKSPTSVPSPTPTPPPTFPILPTNSPFQTNTYEPSKSPTMKCPIGCLTFVIDGCNECECNLDRGYKSCVSKGPCNIGESYCKECNDEEKPCINGGMVAKRVLALKCEFEECVDGQGNVGTMFSICWNVLLVTCVMASLISRNSQL